MKKLLVPALVVLMGFFAQGQECQHKKKVQVSPGYTLEERVLVVEKGLYNVGMKVDKHEKRLNSLEERVNVLEQNQNQPQPQQLQPQPQVVNNIIYVVVRVDGSGRVCQSQPSQRGLPAPIDYGNYDDCVIDDHNNRAYWDNAQSHWYYEGIEPFNYSNCYLHNGNDCYRYENNSRSWNRSNRGGTTSYAPNTYSPTSYAPNTYSSGSHQVYSHGPRPSSFTYGGNPGGGNPNGGPRYNGNPGGGGPRGGNSGGNPGGGARNSGGGGHSGGGHSGGRR